MQLTFGNMTLELNIFHMSKKLITPKEEEGLEEVCIIDTLMEEHCDQNMQDRLNEANYSGRRRRSRRGMHY